MVYICAEVESYHLPKEELQSLVILRLLGEKIIDYMNQDIKDINSEEKPMNPVAEALTAYRKLTGATQDQIANELRATFYGGDEKKLKQVTIAKIEKGSTIGDYRIADYLTKKVLMISLDNNKRVFKVLDRILRCVDIPLDEISHLFMIHTKSSLIGLMKSHLAKDKKNNNKREEYEALMGVVVNDLKNFPNITHIDFPTDYIESEELIPQYIDLNPLALLILYMGYAYIQKNGYGLRDLIAEGLFEKGSTQPKNDLDPELKNFLNKKTNGKNGDVNSFLIECIDEFLQIDEEDAKKFIKWAQQEGLLWKSGDSNIKKRKVLNSLDNLTKFFLSLCPLNKSPFKDNQIIKHILSSHNEPFQEFKEFFDFFPQKNPDVFDSETQQAYQKMKDIEDDDDITWLLDFFKKHLVKMTRSPLVALGSVYLYYQNFYFHGFLHPDKKYTENTQEHVERLIENLPDSMKTLLNRDAIHAEMQELCKTINELLDTLPTNNQDKWNKQEEYEEAYGRLYQINQMLQCIVEKDMLSL